MLLPSSSSSRATISDLCMPWLEPLDTQGKGGRGVYVTDVTGPRFCRFCMRAYNGVARKNNATTNVGRNTGRSNGVRTYAGHEGRRRLRMLRDNCSENIYASYRSNGTVETVDDPACVNARPRTKTGIAGVFPPPLR